MTPKYQPATAVSRTMPLIFFAFLALVLVIKFTAPPEQHQTPPSTAADTTTPGAPADLLTRSQEVLSARWEALVSAPQTPFSSAPPPSYELPCAGPCGHNYITRAARVSDKAADNIRRALCNAPPPVRTSLRPIVINASPGSTGSRSLASSLAALGYRTLHHADSVLPGEGPGKIDVGFADRAKVDPIYAARVSRDTEYCHATAEGYDFVTGFEDFDAFSDTPIPEFWFSAFMAFPNSKIILTHRDPEGWASKRLIHRDASLPYLRPCTHRERSGWDDVGLDGVAELFRANEEFITCVVPEDRLLVMDIFAESQNASALWAKMADFLGKDGEYLSTRCTFPRGLWVKCNKKF